MASDKKKNLSLLTSVLPYKFKTAVSGNNFSKLSHRDRGKTSPLKTSNFKELRNLMYFGLCKARRTALISDGTATSLVTEYICQENKKQNALKLWTISEKAGSWRLHLCSKENKIKFFLF